MVPASPSHVRCHRDAEEGDQTEVNYNDIAFEDSALGRGAQPLSAEVEDHSHQRHAECCETRHRHRDTRSPGEYRNPVERLVNEARHDPLILSS